MFAQQEREPTRGRPALRGKGTYGGRSGQHVEEQGTWASRTRKHSEAGHGRPVDRGAWTAKTVKRSRQQPAMRTGEVSGPSESPVQRRCGQCGQPSWLGGSAAVKADAVSSHLTEGCQQVMRGRLKMCVWGENPLPCKSAVKYSTVRYRANETLLYVHRPAFQALSEPVLPRLLRGFYL